MINEIPEAGREPMGKNGTVSGMEHVFGGIGAEAIEILSFGMDGRVVIWKSYQSTYGSELKAM